MPEPIPGPTRIAELDRERLAATLATLADGAAELDREPCFPEQACTALSASGALSWTVPDAAGIRPPIAAEWQLLRSVAAADGSVGRIFDGHLNAVERIVVAAPEGVRDRELERVRCGRRLLGVWGADPGPGEGEPARLLDRDGSPRLEGTKTFCSGAGGIDAALVMVRPAEGSGPPHLCLVEVDDSVSVDRSWFRGSGLRASESHRVCFDSTPVTAVLGEPGELGREPWFSRDALRTAASWAGMADAAADDAIADLAARRRGEELARLAAGRIAAARGTIDAWLTVAAGAVEAGESLRSISIRARAELIGAATTILDEGARACGSRPFGLGSPLDRARRDLQLFTLQHRIDPLLAAEGRRLLEPEAER